jgi:hypothetical protein
MCPLVGLVGQQETNMDRKQINLHELHEWIADAREIVAMDVYGIAETMLEPEQVHLVDEKASSEELLELQTELQSILVLINRLDTRFHDLFDCQ